MNQHFLSEDNISLLWNILLENPIVRNKQNIVYNAFNVNTKIFYEKEKNK